MLYQRANVYLLLFKKLSILIKQIGIRSLVTAVDTLDALETDQQREQHTIKLHNGQYQYVFFLLICSNIN